MVNNEDMELIKEKLLYKKVIEWTKDYIILDDGTKVYVYCSDQDCCASAHGQFNNVELDAVITDVTYEVTRDSKFVDVYDTVVSNAVLKLFHNKNIIAQNMVEADAGNGAYYYSVASLVIGDFELPILDA